MPPSPENFAEPFASLYRDYSAWLSEQTLSPHSKRAYLVRVSHYIRFLTENEQYRDALTDPTMRDSAVLHFRQYLVEQFDFKPWTTNAILGALYSFSAFLRMHPPRIARQPVTHERPKTLSLQEQQALRDATHTTSSAKKRAVVLLIIDTGIRLHECACLNVQDLRFSTNGAAVFVQGRRESQTRLLPLEEGTAKTLQMWLLMRSVTAPNDEESLFVNASGRRITAKGLDAIVRSVGIAARVEVSGRILRQTFLSNMIENGSDLDTAMRVGGFDQIGNLMPYLISPHAG